MTTRTELDEKTSRIARLNKAREKAQNAPRLGPEAKAKANPKSMRAAINAKCWQCSNYQRKEVTHCTVVDCGLYNLRPWQVA